MIGMEWNDNDNDQLDSCFSKNCVRTIRMLSSSRLSTPYRSLRICGETALPSHRTAMSPFSKKYSKHRMSKPRPMPCLNVISRPTYELDTRRATPFWHSSSSSFSEALFCLDRRAASLLETMYEQAASWDTKAPLYPSLPCS